MNALFYPLILAMHMSDPTASARHDITRDYFGVGAGVELKSGVTIEGTLGMTYLGCVVPDCGRKPGASFSVAWRGKRARR